MQDMYEDETCPLTWMTAIENILRAPFMVVISVLVAHIILLRLISEPPKQINSKYKNAHVAEFRYGNIGKHSPDLVDIIKVIMDYLSMDIFMHHTTMKMVLHPKSGNGWMYYPTLGASIENLDALTAIPDIMKICTKFRMPLSMVIKLDDGGEVHFNERIY